MEFSVVGLLLPLKKEIINIDSIIMVCIESSVSRMRLKLDRVLIDAELSVQAVWFLIHSELVRLTVLEVCNLILQVVEIITI